MSRISREELYNSFASLVALRGTCLRCRNGAVIIKDGRIISTGYNGALKGQQHCTPDTCNEKQPCTTTVHAEANAIAYAAREGIHLGGSTIYCTMQPCKKCAELIIQAGIIEVVYLKAYHDTTSIGLFAAAGVLIRQSLKSSIIPTDGKL